MEESIASVEQAYQEHMRELAAQKEEARKRKQAQIEANKKLLAEKPKEKAAKTWNSAIKIGKSLEPLVSQLTKPKKLIPISTPVQQKPKATSPNLLKFRKD